MTIHSRRNTRSEYRQPGDPTDGPATVPEQDPPRHHATKEEPPTTMPPVIVTPE
jgi:hypothetical protein